MSSTLQGLGQTVPPESPKGAEGYGNWIDAALGGNLASYAYKNAPSLGQIVPGSDPSDPAYQRFLDYGSVPARMAVGPLLQGGEAFRRWMSGDQGPETRQAITESMLGLAGRGLAFEAPGPASFAAYHGSRHLFAPEPGAPLGAFKPIEEVAHTGEGTQAFAYGHYVAGKKGTAESYRTAGLEDREATVKVDGQPYNYMNPSTTDPMKRSLGFDGVNGISTLAYYEGDHIAAIKEMRDSAREMYNRATGKPHNLETYDRMLGIEQGERLTLEAEQKYRNIFKSDDLMEARRNLSTAKWIEDNHQRVEITNPPEGHLYNVEVRPDEHELLDWDRPLSQQSPEVQDKLAGMGFRDSDLGEHIYGQMARGVGDAPAASRLLHGAGIPGVKFMDAGSRHLHPDDPDVTRNYVVFHHQNLKVTGRDGQTYTLEPVEHDPMARAKP